MGDYGERLVDLHLLKSSDFNSPIVKFQGKGDYRVERLDMNKAIFFISNDQYFEGILPGVWGYQIGGYQACDKWLKDRKGRRLSLDEIKHCCKTVRVLSKTIEIQKAINKIYPEFSCLS